MTASTRCDQWLWAVRLFKTRRLAAEICAAGKAKRSGHPLKASTALHPGDTLEIPFPDGPGHRTITVITLIAQRVAAPLATACYRETTPPTVLEMRKAHQHAANESPKGRPTKKNRRDIDRIHGFWD